MVDNLTPTPGSAPPRRAISFRPLRSVLAPLFSRFCRRRMAALDARAGANVAAEDARRRTEAILSAVGEGIYGLSPNGQVVFVNRAAADMLGWGAEDFLTRNQHDLVHHSHLDGSAYPVEDCPIQHTLRDGKVRSVDEDVFWHKDGTPFPVEYVVTPIRENDAAAGAVVAFRGVAERKNAEARLRHLAAIVASSDDAIVSKTLDGIVTSWNPGAEHIFGYAAEEIVGRPVSILFPPDCLEEETSVLARIARGETVTHYEAVRIRKDGRAIDVSVTVSPLRDKAGKIVGASKIARDISGGKALEAELKRSNADLDQFAYTASHDMREPLRMISAYLGLLERREGAVLSADGHEFLSFAKDGAQRLDRMILALLDYSRIGRGSEPPAPVALGEVVDEAIANLGLAIKAAGARVEVGGAPPVALGDRGELVRLFQNLIANAIKFRAPEREPVVKVEARRDASILVVSVADNGIGIAPENQGRIFGIFQRLHGSEVEGCGIGLASCRKIVEHHGGRIWVESEAGKGSTFFLTLPIAPGAT